MLIMKKSAHDKTNKMICAPGDDSHKPGRQTSHIKLFSLC